MPFPLTVPLALKLTLPPFATTESALKLRGIIGSDRLFDSARSPQRRRFLIHRPGVVGPIRPTTERPIQTGQLNPRPPNSLQSVALSAEVVINRRVLPRGEEEAGSEGGRG